MIVKYLRFAGRAKCDVDREDVASYVTTVVSLCLSDEAGRPSSFQAKHGIVKRPRHLGKTISKLASLTKYPPSA